MQALQAFIKTAGLTQKEFADKAGVPESAISRLIKGKRRVSWPNAVKISKATRGRVKVEEIVAGAPATAAE